MSKKTVTRLCCAMALFFFYINTYAFNCPPLSAVTDSAVHDQTAPKNGQYLVIGKVPYESIIYMGIIRVSEKDGDTPDHAIKAANNIIKNLPLHSPENIMLGNKEACLYYGNPNIKGTPLVIVTQWSQ